MIKRFYHRLTSFRPILSLTALVLLISLCVSCTKSAENTSSTSSAARPLTFTETISIQSPPLVSDETAVTSETEAISPEPELPLEMLQAVFQATPRDAAYMSMYDLTANRLLYSTGESQMIYPASTTKLITILYALTIADAGDYFTVGDEIKIAPADSSKAWISEGQTLTLRDLIAAMLLPSGNDAAYTVAVNCGRKAAATPSLGSEEALKIFMDGLNQYAQIIGLTGSHFVTPDGYHDPEHYTTMQDMAIIAHMAYENELMAEIMAMPSYTATPKNSSKSMTWENTNLLLSENSKYYYPPATGMKTGYHSDAGVCLIATAEHNGRTLMVLLFKGNDKNARFSDANMLLELGFSILEA